MDFLDLTLVNVGMSETGYYIIIYVLFDLLCSNGSN